MNLSSAKKKDDELTAIVSKCFEAIEDLSERERDLVRSCRRLLGERLQLSEAQEKWLRDIAVRVSAPVAQSPGDLAKMQRVQAISAAIEALGGHDPDLAGLLERAKECQGIPPVRIVIDQMEGGQFCEVVASAPVALIVCDNSLRDAQSVHQFVFGEKVFIDKIDVEVNPARMLEWECELNSSEDYRLVGGAKASGISIEEARMAHFGGAGGSGYYFDRAPMAEWAKKGVIQADRSDGCLAPGD